MLLFGHLQLMEAGMPYSISFQIPSTLNTLTLCATKKEEMLPVSRWCDSFTSLERAPFMNVSRNNYEQHMQITKLYHKYHHDPQSS